MAFWSIFVLIDQNNENSFEIFYSAFMLILIFLAFGIAITMRKKQILKAFFESISVKNASDEKEKAL